MRRSHSSRIRNIRWFLLACLALVGIIWVETRPYPTAGLQFTGATIARAAVIPGIYMPIIMGGSQGTVHLGPYVVLGWNDLGMHCYNWDFQYIGVLPPFNNLWAQVIKRGDPPQIVTKGIQVSYSFPDNTYSAGKSNFWTYAKPLFGALIPLANNLPDNIGLTGKGLAGTMDIRTDSTNTKIDHFQVDGIPLTEFSDSAPTTRQPYQLASLVAKDNATGNQLASLTVVAPVSTEMHCDNCHANGKDPGGSLGKTELNILALHDHEIGYTAVGSTCGAGLVFLVARYLARDWVAGKLAGTRLMSLDEKVARQGWKIVAITRLVPVFSFSLLNYAFGLTRISFWPYLAATFVCMLPSTIAYVYFSSNILGLLQGKISSGLIIGVILIVVVSLIPVIYKWRKAQAGEPLDI